MTRRAKSPYYSAKLPILSCLDKSETIGVVFDLSCWVGQFVEIVVDCFDQQAMRRQIIKR